MITYRCSSPRDHNDACALTINHYCQTRKKLAKLHFDILYFEGQD